ncbi:hypothetical protein F66182_9778 [Fusarium sp. NRRL 66182]|nr:hypothetical protein F66182_9778 [Fusarium sp. NRRL 66182]
MGKASGPSAQLATTARIRQTRRKRHSPRSSVPVPTIEKDDNVPLRTTRRHSAAQTISQDQLLSSQGRVTRSHRGDASLAKLPTPTPRKRRSAIAKSLEQPAKRHRDNSSKDVDEDQLEQQEQQEQQKGEPPLSSHDEPESDDEDDNGSALPRQDLVDGINMVIGIDGEHNRLPKLRPGDSVEKSPELGGRTIAYLGLIQDEQADTVEPVDDNVALGHGTITAAVEEPRENPDPATNPGESDDVPGQFQVAEQEVPESTQPRPQPDSSQKEPARSSQRKKRRQSKKPTYGEPNYGANRVSRDLGADIPQTQATQPSSSKHVRPDHDPYAFNGSDSELQTQKFPEKLKRKMRASSVEPSRQDKQDQPERLSQGDAQAQSKDGGSDEEGDEGYNSSDDELAAEEEELDASCVAEDSLLLDSPPEASLTGDPIPTAWISRKQVQRLNYLMTLAGFLHKRRWESGIRHLAEDEKQKLEQQQKNKAGSRVLSRIILVRLFELYELCGNIPSSPLFNDQLAYLREHATELNTLISTIRKKMDEFVSKINGTIEKGTPEDSKYGYQSVAKIYKRIIPMLVLVLDQAFQTGCKDSLQSTQRAANQKGEFTIHLLEPMERAAGWAQRLAQIVENWFELYPVRKDSGEGDQAMEHWKQFNSDTEKLKRVLQKARSDIEVTQRAPEERRKAMQMDEAVRKAREARAQQLEQARLQKMQHFIKLTHALPSQAKISPSQQEAHFSYPPVSQSGSTEPQEALRETYFEKHGWHYWEDDQLLSLIRTTSHPNYRVFSEVLPERSPAEVRERARYLRTVVRDKYVRKGISPPGWCTETD